MKKRIRAYGVFRTAIALLGSLIAFYGVCIGLYRPFAYVFIAVGAALILLSYFWERIKKTGIVTKIALLTLFAVIFADFAVCEARIIYASKGKETDASDYVIILGAKVNGETPSMEFAERIRLAASYLAENPASVVITTGGKGNDEQISEGIAARRMLLSLGIAEERILTEEKSTSTDENFMYSLELIKENGGSENSKITVVSSSFHLFRASLIAEKYGFSDIYTMGSTGKLLLVPFYYVREYFAYTQYRLFD